MRVSTCGSCGSDLHKSHPRYVLGFSPNLFRGLSFKKLFRCVKQHPGYQLHAGQPNTNLCCNNELHQVSWLQFSGFFFFSCQLYVKFCCVASDAPGSHQVHSLYEFFGRFSRHVSSSVQFLSLM